jgi:2-dehydro-3-deoxyphosphogluconate aldolase/(4S)-4-hydroxy-2-oxoglutarate aldolase
VNGPVHPAVAVIRSQRVIGIVRASSSEQADTAARCLLAAGLRAVEVSLTTPGALDVVAGLVECAASGVAIGVGTVMTVDQAHAVAAAGATFLVAPVFDPAVTAAGREAGLACVPAAATPTEACAALAAGANLVKLFPASLWSPAALKDVLTALPELPLVPTGGVTPEQAPQWIAAGAVAVGVGAALTRGTGAEVQQRIQTLLAQLGRAS